ncbi:Hpt domain-containing protein [uncultured Pseudodesulfovibrio sp.]|uniref:Hpt domain-containing protein n=1 Tax=uncultured Pseudodesulfovibrio sp. TaxID=2035858 RepID=UPI0029C7D62F|nr:Hpt domain-containing protein [uncultured Pseudodesulfovibrio sp.]
MTQPIFNSDRFVQSLAGDMELARELLVAFMEDSPERADSLGKALDDGDLKTVVKLAHSLKGMCGVVRTDDLVERALTMENTAQNGDLEKVREQFVQFAAVLAAAHESMRSFMDSH